MRELVPDLPGLIELIIAIAGTGLFWLAVGEPLPAIVCGVAIVVGTWAAQIICKE